MVIWMLSALIIAFLVSCVSGKLYIPWLKKRGFVQPGKLYIPWLKKRGFVQPLKDEVNQIVYQAEHTSEEHN